MTDFINKEHRDFQFSYETFSSLSTLIFEQIKNKKDVFFRGFLGNINFEFRVEDKPGWKGGVEG